MNDGIVSDRNIVADIYRSFLIGTMDDCTILDVDVVPDPDGMNIAANHGIEPYTAVIAQYNIACDCGIVGQKSIFPPFWQYTFYGFDERHIFCFSD